MTTQRTCNACRFYCLPKPPEEMGECRKNPPSSAVIPMPQKNVLAGGVQMVPTPMAYWPAVKPNSWCGAFEPLQHLLQ